MKIKWLPFFLPLVLVLVTSFRLPQPPRPENSPLDPPQEVLFDACMYDEGWSMLSQPRFWQRVIRISPDTSIISVADSRQILGIFPTSRYDKLSPEGKDAFKDSVRFSMGLAPETRLYITFGRSHFYLLKETIPAIQTAVPIFQEVGVDPWFAQAILLIESPGMNRQSNKGAYGGFQLMKSVANKYGLVVNKTVDERGDLSKSARAAARFIQSICIPHTKAILDSYGIPYQENELWFRLLVMHVYHAGPGNVRGVMGAIQPTRGGMDLIRTIWHTEYGNFKNSSQNYSQIALACWMELDRLMGRTQYAPVQMVQKPASIPDANLYPVSWR